MMRIKLFDLNTVQIIIKSKCILHIIEEVMQQIKLLSISIILHYLSFVAK